MRIWEHPDFERVAASFREAVRAKDEAAIERVRGELRRLVKENTTRRIQVAAEENVFVEKPKRRQRRSALNGPPREEDAVLPDLTPVVRIDDLISDLEFAVVGEPFVYRRGLKGASVKRATRFLMNVFVADVGMRVLDADPVTFHEISSLHDEVDFEVQFVVLKPTDQGAPVVEAGSPVPKRLATRIARARRFDLSELAEHLIASAPAKPDTQGRNAP
jgi:hypothetical protein